MLEAVTEGILIILFGWAVYLSGYTPSVYEPFPIIIFHEQKCLECGVYMPLPHPEITVAELLVEEKDVQLWALLVHEYVHYLQDVNGRAGPGTCRRNERESYRVQNEFLEMHGEPKFVVKDHLINCI